MKGFRKSVLMGAALALLLGAAAAAEESTEETAAERFAAEAEQTEAETGIVTEAEQTEAETGIVTAAEQTEAETGIATAAPEMEAVQTETAAEQPRTDEPEAQTDEPETEALPDESVLRDSFRAAAKLDAGYLTVTWAREKEGSWISYIQGKDDAEITAIDSGVWELEIQVDFQPKNLPVLTDGEYSCTLVWPAAAKEEESLFCGADGDILINGSSGFGTWALDKQGNLTLKPENIGSLSKVTGWITAFVQVGKEEAFGPDVRPDRPDITKEGLFDAAAQKVFWRAEAVVPAWDGNQVYSWCVHDVEKTTPASWSESFKNDYSRMTVDGASEGTAWYYEAKEDGSALIWFLNPCTCDEEPCEDTGVPGQCGGSPCAHVKVTDASGQAWCSCWHQKENSTFVLDYFADTAELQQQMQESGEKEVLLNNYAELLQNGEWVCDASDRVNVHQAVRKAESEAPALDNDYSSTCTITVNPSFDDYSGAEFLEVTDQMENLTYLGDSLTVSCLHSDGTETALTQIAEGEAAALGREGNEDRFFSIETSGEDSCFIVSLWYPTKASYTLTYRAAVSELVPGEIINYQNTATVGKVSSTVKGKGFRADDAWFGETFEAMVLKVDAQSGKEDPKGLTGAVFEVRQVTEDGEDLLLDTLTTGEDGTDVFRTKREEGILVTENTLYYLQESLPPEGYERNEEKYYFYFSPEDDMVLPDGITAAKGEKPEDAEALMYRLTIVVPDEPVVPRELPAAGGPGEALFFVLGLAFVAASKRTLLPG